MIIKIYGEKCTGCGICIDVCPKGPRIYEIKNIEGKEKCVVLDASWCQRCTNCVSKCPKDAIKLIKNNLLKQ